jgi:deoxyribonuclease-4
MLLGAHVPVAGGLHLAPARGRAIGAEAIQIFTRNKVQWRARPVSADEAAAFRSALAESGIAVVLTHCSYLVNLASPERGARERSVDSFLAEMDEVRDVRLQRRGEPRRRRHVADLLRAEGVDRRRRGKDRRAREESGELRTDRKCKRPQWQQHGAYSVAASAPATNLYFARAHCNVCSKFSMERIK